MEKLAFTEEERKEYQLQLDNLFLAIHKGMIEKRKFIYSDGTIERRSISDFILRKLPKLIMDLGLLGSEKGELNKNLFSVLELSKDQYDKIGSGIRAIFLMPAACTSCLFSLSDEMCERIKDEADYLVSPKVFERLGAEVITGFLYGLRGEFLIDNDPIASIVRKNLEDIRPILEGLDQPTIEIE